MPFILLSCLLGAFSVWLITFGVKQKKENARLREICTVEITGIVADYILSGTYKVDSEGEVSDSRSAFPVFSYTVNDRTYTHKSPRYDSRGELRYEVGQQIPVFHAPGDPETIYIPSEDSAQNARLCIIFGASLLAFIAFGVTRAFVCGI